MGVGRPTYVLSRRSSSDWNATSRRAARKPASSSSSAGMIVSGTYWPPYGPNRPRVLGAALVGAVVIGANCLHKSSDQARVLAAGRIFDAAADVDAERGQRRERAGNVVDSQPPGDQTARPDTLQRRPVEGLAG